MDADKYNKNMEERQKKFEAICVRCGECCGSEDDPCENLVKKNDGTCFCSDYESRLGPRKTISGFSFNCVPIQEHIHNDTLRQNCGYRVRN
ncbi:MAG: hypothetical protein KAI70_07375 [Candidatus Omnitrophica bacterium]|nr:hypothetical protein [Candidatus Omnitrophota bacterium]